MRITFILPEVNLSGGVRVVAVYAERLVRRGHQVLVVAAGRKPRGLRDRVRDLVKEGKWPFGQKRDPGYFDGLPVELRLLPHPGPVTDADLPEADVVVATWWKTAVWVAGLSPSRGRKAHFMQHYESWGGTPEQVDAAYRLPIPKIVLTEWLAGIVRERFGQEPLALVPNSVDTDLFHAPPRGKRPVPTVGLTYFRIEPKGCDISLQAFELARKEEPRLKLVSMGYEDPIPTLPLPADAEFHHRPPQEQLPDLYAACDAWLFGSRVEGFGLPILEAMACRTPVIGTPAGAAPELLAKGGGLLVPGEDPPAMAAAILNVARMNEEEWRGVSDRALATVTGYTWDDATDRFEAALRKVAEG
jgi:glycosyltransferase involved in cell wall biosynthesis